MPQKRCGVAAKLVDRVTNGVGYAQRQVPLEGLTKTIDIVEDRVTDGVVIAHRASDRTLRKDRSEAPSTF